MKRLHLFVFGRVQGVFFRANTRALAHTLNLKGFVRNLPDGSVEIVAEGEEEKLKELLEWAKRGPEGAVVEDMKIEWGEAKGEFKDFEIKY